MRDFSNVVKLILRFASTHSMIEEAVYFNSIDDYEDHSFKESTLFVLPVDGEISREDGNPIYTLSFAIGIVQKFSTADVNTQLDAHSSALFVAGQLNDYMIQELPVSSTADINSITFDGSKSKSNTQGSTTWLDCVLTVTLPRNTYKQEIALDD